MRDKGTKSHFVGLRMTGEENRLLSEAQEKSKLSKTDVLLRGLEMAAEYYSLGLDERPLSRELRDLEEEARRHAESLMRIRTREKAIKEMIAELKEVDAVIDKVGCRPNNLIQILLAIQQKNHWLPRHALLWVAERLQIPIARIYQIANFYDAFSLEPRGAHLVQVCTGSACHMLGARQLLSRIEEVVGIKPGETDSEQLFTLNTVHCLGCCALGPVVKVDEDYHSDPNKKEIEEIVAGFKAMEK